MKPSLDEIIRELSEPIEPIDTGVQPQLRVLPSIRAVVFDIYGTLLISGSGDVGTTASERREWALDRTLAALNVNLQANARAAIESFEQVITQSHLSSKQKGLAFPEVDILDVWKRTLTELPSPDGQQFTDWEPRDWQRLSLHFELRVNPAWPMPGANATLEWLRQRHSILGIVSNAQFFTPNVLSVLLGRSLDGLGFQRELIYFSYEHLQAKPGPFLFESIGRQLRSQGVLAHETLYVGNDMLNDITASAQVGFRTALFAGDQRSLRWRQGDERVSQVGPDVVITELNQLRTCLA